MPKHETLAAALAAFQAELPKLRKDETAKVKGESQDGRPVNYSYGYADLAQVVEAVSMCLGQHGMAFTAFPTVDDRGAFGLEYSLLHEGGEERKGWWPLPDPMRVKPQQLGSAITYARRYAQMAVTNTFPDKEDDDGAAAFPTGHRDQAMTPEQFDNLPRERQGASRTDPALPPPTPKTWSDDEIAEQHGKLETLDLAKAVQLYDWMGAKDLHTRQVTIMGHPTGADELRVSATDVLAYRLADNATKTTAMVDLKTMRTIAADRGLLKIQVSEKETLDDALIAAEIHAQALHDARVATPNAEKLRAEAADSWDPRDDQSPGSYGSSNG